MKYVSCRAINSKAYYVKISDTPYVENCDDVIQLILALFIYGIKSFATETARPDYLLKILVLIGKEYFKCISDPLFREQVHGPSKYVRMNTDLM
jgi:hypothetical protein